MNYLIKQVINGHQDFSHVDYNITSMLGKNVRALQLVSNDKTYVRIVMLTILTVLNCLHMLSVLAKLEDECAHTSVSTCATMNVHETSVNHTVHAT